MKSGPLSLSLAVVLATAACGSSGSGGDGSVGDGGGTIGAKAGDGSAVGGTDGGGTAGTSGTTADGSATDANTTVASDASTADGGTLTPTDGKPSPMMNFFVSSDTSMTGNLGGLAGADQRCQMLAAKVGAGSRTWVAYLSADAGPDGMPVNAKDRIGNGPWFNSRGAQVAATLGELHMRAGDYAVFIDENGNPIPGQWPGSPMGVQHDILTGSNVDGTLNAGKTCMNWTSAMAGLQSAVGHSDGLGPMASMAANYRPWNYSHTGMCSDTAPGGGAGRIYCFAKP